MIYKDDGGRACKNDDNLSQAVVAEGIGNVDGLTLDILGASGKCVSIEKEFTFDLSFRYDPASDSIEDSTGVIWER